MDRESTIYNAIVGVCESIERGERAVGNGHHLAQELAGLAETAIAERKDSAPPAFPPEVMEAARETLRIAESNADPIEVADAGLALARLVLGACPHALTASRLADGALATDEDAAALADASNH